MPNKISLIIVFLFYLLFAVLGCDSSVDSNETKINPENFEGFYLGSVEVKDFKTGRTWDNRSAELDIDVDSEKGNADINSYVFGTDLQGGRIDFNIQDCKLVSNPIECRYEIDDTIQEIDASLSDSSAFAEIRDYERGEDGNLKLVIRVKGMFEKER